MSYNKPPRTYEEQLAIIESLLEHSVYIRNLCAHHARLWNRRFTITMSLPQRQPAALVASLNPKENRRVYNTLTLLAHIVDMIALTVFVRGEHIIICCAINK